MFYAHGGGGDVEGELEFVLDVVASGGDGYAVDGGTEGPGLETGDIFEGQECTPAGGGEWFGGVFAFGVGALADVDLCGSLCACGDVVDQWAQCV
ncbi:hypothetical protein [Mycobacterium riyadhense]|uniref:hypothetical protein n=1 Tax=Mycobacterium riyadhense TaxID=486698 RepID=UPI0019520884|nr:hypothetical protein [Mycobacterium riyadhense]